MKHYRKYKIKYFERFGIQRQIFAAKLDEAFFKEWHDKLSINPEGNWHQTASTCIRLLVEHPDAPEWLRDIYAVHPRYDRRHTAFLSRSGNYKYKNIDRILADRSNTIKTFFFHSVLYDLKNGIEVQPEHLSKTLESPSSIPSLKVLLKQTISEEVGALIHPDPTVRTLAKIFYNASPEQKQLLLSSTK